MLSFWIKLGDGAGTVIQIIHGPISPAPRKKLKRKKIEHHVSGDHFAIGWVVDGTPRLHDYGLKKSTWYRGVLLLKRYGGDRAQELMDARAEKCLMRDDRPSCV